LASHFEAVSEFYSRPTLFAVHEVLSEKNPIRPSRLSCGMAARLNFIENHNLLDLQQKPAVNFRDFENLLGGEAGTEGVAKMGFNGSAIRFLRWPMVVYPGEKRYPCTEHPLNQRQCDPCRTDMDILYP
jgi:hypothetical protein